MAPTNATTELALCLERTYAAPPEQVFDAWTRADAIAQWFAPTTEHAVVVTALDARVGGRYRIEMRHQSGAVHVVTGVYQELVSPTKLVMTWAWEGQEALGHTLVTVRLTPVGSGTQLQLVHERFPSDTARAEHEKGWTGCFERLTALLTNAV